MADSRPYGLLSAVVVMAGVVASMWLLSGAIVRSRGGDEMIRVTGSARKPIQSDLIIWSGTVSYRASTIPAAFTAVRKGVDTTLAYLREKGVSGDEIVTKAVRTTPVMKRIQANNYDGERTTNEIEAYDLSQEVEVRSKKVELVGKIARESTDLIARGVSFQSNDPQYLFTGIADVKVEILAKAAEDARRRAEEIAKASGASVKDVRYARMSPLQITPLYSQEVSGEGQNDTTSQDKAITAIVTMGFGLK